MAKAKRKLQADPVLSQPLARPSKNTSLLK
jgi:hypothetical protein